MTHDEARYEQWMEDLYREHREQAIEEFTANRLKSYWVRNPWVLRSPVNVLAEAEKLAREHTTAAFVFATIAVEVGLKVALLKPIVHGLVHSESTAEIIADLALRHTRFDFFHRLLSKILDEHGGVDLEHYTRAGATQRLMDEIAIIQKQRDLIVHRADHATLDQTNQALSVARAVLEDLVPTVVSRLGLHLHDGVRVCEDWQC